MTRVDGQPESDGRPTAASNEPVWPQLEWEEDDGSYIVELLGIPNYAIIADGKTREEALHKLGAILFHVFNDACTEPEAHLSVVAVDPVGPPPVAPSGHARQGYCLTCGGPCVYQGTHP